LLAIYKNFCAVHQILCVVYQNFYILVLWTYIWEEIDEKDEDNSDDNKRGLEVKKKRREEIKQQHQQQQ